MELVISSSGEVGGSGGRELGCRVCDAEREVGRLLGPEQRVWVGARGQCLEGVEKLQGSSAVGSPVGGVQEGRSAVHAELCGHEGARLEASDQITGCDGGCDGGILEDGVVYS
jgi:hypothetical protein